MKSSSHGKQIFRHAGAFLKIILLAIFISGIMVACTKSAEEKSSTIIVPEENRQDATGEKQEIQTSPRPEQLKEPPLRIDWQPLPSPPGGGYWTMAIAPSDPETILIASRDFNVIKTTNGGKTWQILGEKLFGAHIFSPLAIHPTEPNTFFVSNGAIYYTTDGGTVWYGAPAEQIGTGEGEGVTALAYNPDNAAVLYAAEGNSFFSSSDGGKNWERKGHVEGATIRGIAAPGAASGELLYSMASDSGIFKSTDQGKTWVRKNSGITGTFQYRHLVYDEQSTTLYLATDNGLYVSSDGEYWQNKEPFQNGNAPVTVAPAGSVIYATTDSGKLYKSTDKGNSWNIIYTADDIESHHGFNYAVAVHQAHPDTIYVATDNKILKSVDGGKSWNNIGTEVYDDALFVADYAADTETLWVGAYWTRGLFTTTNDGKTWRFLESWRSTEPHDHYPMSLEVNPLNGKEVYVSGAAGVKKTSNDGESWIALGEGTPLAGKHSHGMSLDPAEPSTIYAGTAPGWDQEYQTSQAFKSTDSGKTWKKLNDFPSREENNVYAFAVAGETMYVTLNQHESDKGEEHHNALGVWKSADGGITWQDVSSNLPNKNAFSVAIHPQNHEIVYVGLGHIEQFTSKGEQGLFQSADGGLSWQRLAGLPELQPSKILFHPANPEVVLVAFGEHICGACAAPDGDADDRKYPRGEGVWGSADAGETWHNLVPEGKLTKRQLAVMDIVFKDESTLYAITDDGVFKGRIIIPGKTS